MKIKTIKPGGILLAVLRSLDSGKSATVDVGGMLKYAINPPKARWFDPMVAALLFKKSRYHVTCAGCGRRLWFPMYMSCIKPKCVLNRKRVQKALSNLDGDIELDELLDFSDPNNENFTEWDD